MPASAPTLLRLKVLYLVLAGAPLAVAAIGHPHAGRGFLVELAVGLGFVGFAMLALQFALTAKFRGISRALGLDTLLHFHRQIGLLAFGFILAHLVILVASSPAYAAFLDPRVEPLRALALWFVLVALVAIIVTTLWRRQLGIPYEWWRLGHGVLALAIVFIGLVHILRVGWYVSGPWKQAVWVGTTLAAIGLLLYARVWKPLRLRNRPWKVAEVRPERGESWTLAFEPEGHAGMPFRAGQFIWVELGGSPFSMDQHPFSISSGEDRPDRLEVTVKELGDYSASIGETQPGTRAWLEGPYGSFILDGEAETAVFVSGGIGITPAISILRSIRGSGRRPRCLLLYGVPSLEDATFHEELAEMAAEPWLEYVPVVESPPEGWSGERGFVDADILDRHLPADGDGVRYFVCGPDPMMDVVEGHLRERRVPLGRIHSERFNIA
jgi:predicted ferric reductase